VEIICGISVKKDAPLAEIQLDANKAGLDKMTDGEIEARNPGLSPFKKPAKKVTVHQGYW